MAGDDDDSNSPSGQQEQPQQQQQQQQQQKASRQNKPPLSCVSCRSRKLKCDRQDPCRNCVRSHSECVFPERKRIQRPRKNKNTELLQRLSRLESIVSSVGVTNVDSLEASGQAGGETNAATAAEANARRTAAGELPGLPSSIEASSKTQDDVADPLGLKDSKQKPPLDSTASQYLSGQFWSSLCDEVGGLRVALEQSTDTEESEDEEEATPESIGDSPAASVFASPGLLMGIQQSRGGSGMDAVQHPSPNHIRYLTAVYFRNVDMHLKILHRPTVMNALYDLATRPETANDLNPEQTAIFFAVYYAAITSLTPTDCMHNLRQSRAQLATHFQSGIEQALLEADYLNSTSLETLQALTLYICCLRSHNGSRASWALLGLPVRLAQALNIHQDGDGTHLRVSPFEAEQRRRLWWQLIVLDIRAAEDRGSNTVIARGSYNTRLPHNLDDVEFGPESLAPLVDRPGPSDTTFGLFTAQCSGMFLWSENSRQNIGEQETLRQAKHLEEQYVKNADPQHVGSYLSSVTVKLIILKMWLVTRYPLHARGDKVAPGQSCSKASAALPDRSAPSSAAATTTTTETTALTDPRRGMPVISRQSTLRLAVSIMELSGAIETGPYSDRFRWWSETYVQWHPLAVTLAELCSQTSGEIVDHAWEVVEDVFPRWGVIIADTKRGSLWRPIRKLYKKAKAAREAALTCMSAVGGQSHSQSQLQPQYPAPSRPNSQQTQEQQAPAIWGQSTLPLSVNNNNSPRSAAGNNFDTAMAIDATSTASDADHALRPRLITDMLISEGSGHTSAAYGSGPPMSYMPSTSTAPAPTTTPTANRSSPGIGTRIPGGPFPFAFDSIMSENGQSMAQALLGWPDMGFDPTNPNPDLNLKNNTNTNTSMSMSMGMSMPDMNLNMTYPGTAAGGFDPTHPHPHSQGPSAAATIPTSAMTGDPILRGGYDSGLLDTTNMMDWSTWDEFVLDTYADTTPKSGSGGSEP
ncbi:fungal-specific transcription factor domain-containing protein [Astrocystis sublimbata]|nr:fungal-specific transcription factor domain-containing protein [Astrocystis sublimbata]